VERPSEIVLGQGTGRNIAPGGLDLPPDLGDGLENAALVGDIALDAFDQIWNQLAAATELNIDQGPGIANAVAKASVAIKPAINNDAIVRAIVFALGLSFHDRRS
jgi:hypothetical protein